VLFVDNMDQIDDEAEWATVADLLRGVVANPGWRAVVTSGTGTAEWKKKLPKELVKGSLAAVAVEELSEAETAQLSAANQALKLLLDNAHPARAMARNLFHLSRLFDLRDEQGLGAIARETDLAKAWWRFGGGKGEAGKLGRLKVLRQLGSENIAQPGRTAFRVDAFEAATVTELLGADSLREVREGLSIGVGHSPLIGAQSRPLSSTA